MIFNTPFLESEYCSPPLFAHVYIFAWQVCKNSKQGNYWSLKILKW